MPQGIERSRTKTVAVTSELADHLQAEYVFFTSVVEDMQPYESEEYGTVFHISKTDNGMLGQQKRSVQLVHVSAQTSDSCLVFSRTASKHEAQDERLSQKPAHSVHDFGEGDGAVRSNLKYHKAGCIIVPARSIPLLHRLEAEASSVVVSLAQ